MTLKKIYHNEHETQLKPDYDARQSFYGKAILKTEYITWADTITNEHIETEAVYSLRSYNTVVAQLRVKFGEDGKAVSKKLKVRDTYSATTLRHIKEFIKQMLPEYRALKITKAMIERDFMQMDS